MSVGFCVLAHCTAQNTLHKEALWYQVKFVVNHYIAYHKHLAPIAIRQSGVIKGADPHDPGRLDFSSEGLLAPEEQKIS